MFVHDESLTRYGATLISHTDTSSELGYTHTHLSSEEEYKRKLPLRLKLSLCCSLPRVNYSADTKCVGHLYTANLVLLVLYTYTKDCSTSSPPHKCHVIKSRVLDSHFTVVILLPFKCVGSTLLAYFSQFCSMANE